MVDGEEKDLDVRYWKTKYDLLQEDYQRTKERTENLENRLLDIVEESERKENEKEEINRKLEKELNEANRRIEQLEAACFRYKNQSKANPSVTSDESNETRISSEKEKNSDETDIVIQKLRTIRTTSGESARSSIDGITRSPEFHAGDHLICEYHKLPVLSKGEGFIYGFRWNITNKIHIV